jgi:hypothetical protein
MPKNEASAAQVSPRPSKAPVTSRRLVSVETWYSAWPKAAEDGEDRALDGTPAPVRHRNRDAVGRAAVEGGVAEADQP